ncbi:MAG: CoA transferase, partial [Candidatus Binataceae bacterium]
MDDMTLVPEPFGPLQGIRVLSTGSLIAQPFASSLMADMGAEVIHVERPGIGDGWRVVGIRLPTSDGGPPVATNWIQERRNIFCITLDLARPGSHEIFFRLIRRADLWMENSKPGTYARWGLDDDTVMRENGKLVIVHVSGYGASGHPDYASRAS